MEAGRRWQRWGVRVLGLGLVLLSIEGLVRLGTWLQFRAATAEFPELRERRREAAKLREPLTVGILIDRAAIYPAVFADEDGPARIVPFAELEPTDFVDPPIREEPEPGVVRIAFLGGAETRDGYPAEVQTLLDASVGEGRVEVVNLGIPGSHSATTALLAERFVPRYRPHLVVVYLGFDDLVFYRGRARAIALAARREASFESPGLAVAPAARGLVEMVWVWGAPTSEPLAWLDKTWITEPIATYWELDRLVASHGGELWVSTPAGPDRASLSDADRRYFDLELATLWPVLGDGPTHAADRAGYQAAIRAFTEQSGASLIDVAAALSVGGGGRTLFDDNARLTEAGVDLHARTVADALLPRVRSLLAAGAPLPIRVELPEPRQLVAGPAPVLEPGRCVRGPCPEQTCYVAGGSVRYGNDEADLGGILARQRAGIGVAEDFWFEDETPEIELAVSPFCVDRTEASVEAHQRCQAARACPRTFGSRPSSSASPATEASSFPTLDDARAFCRWRGGRLPTDVEFDAAARGDDRLMPWGDAWTGVEANFCGAECWFGDPDDAEDGFDGAAPIGTFTGVSPSGAIDMAGNLWEWVDECFDSSTHRRFPAGTLDPIVGPLPECRRFLRGGSYRSYAGVLERRTASGMPDTDIPTRGARCVFDFGTRHEIVTAEVQHR